MKKRPPGRPTKLTKKIIDKAKEYFNGWEPYYETPVDKQDREGNVTTSMKRCANPPPTLLRLADYLGIDRITIYRWARAESDGLGENNELLTSFCNIIKKEMAAGFEQAFMENAMTGEYSAPIAIFTAKNKLGWHDKQQIETDQTIKVTWEFI